MIKSEDQDILSLCSTSLESPTDQRSETIPHCYHKFQVIFCPKTATQLPPHRPRDCVINLIEGEPVPCGQVYPLSIPEQKAMEEYVEKALFQCYIHPSMSPAASSFFFVAKKGGGLGPCINYRALNKITIKNQYPLPLSPSDPRKSLRSPSIYQVGPPQCL